MYKILIMTLFLSISSAHAASIGDTGNATFMCNEEAVQSFMEAAEVGADEANAVYDKAVVDGSCAGFYPSVPAQIISKHQSYTDFAGTVFDIWQIDVPQDVDDMLGWSPYIWIKR